MRTFSFAVTFCEIISGTENYLSDLSLHYTHFISLFTQLQVITDVQCPDQANNAVTNATLQVIVFDTQGIGSKLACKASPLKRNNVVFEFDPYFLILIPLMARLLT